MKIINLTQHAATPEQVKAGVFEPTPGKKTAVNACLNFIMLPSRRVIRVKADRIAAIARQSGADAAMIGGAPYLMGPLEQALRDNGVQPLYAFSERVSVEEEQPDGSVRKTNVFKHLGFVEG